MPLRKPENAHVFKQFDLSGAVAAITGGVRGIGTSARRIQITVALTTSQVSRPREDLRKPVVMLR